MCVHGYITASPFLPLPLGRGQPLPPLLPHRPREQRPRPEAPRHLRFEQRPRPEAPRPLVSEQRPRPTPPRHHHVEQRPRPTPRRPPRTEVATSPSGSTAASRRGHDLSADPTAPRRADEAVGVRHHPARRRGPADSPRNAANTRGANRGVLAAGRMLPASDRGGGRGGELPNGPWATSRRAPGARTSTAAQSSPALLRRRDAGSVATLLAPQRPNVLMTDRGAEARGLDPRGLDPRGLDPRGLHPPGLHPPGLDRRGAPRGHAPRGDSRTSSGRVTSGRRAWAGLRSSSRGRGGPRSRSGATGSARRGPSRAGT